MNKLFATVALAALFAAPAMAADMPVKAPRYAVPPPVVTSWTGVYVGGHFGGGWGTKDWNQTRVDVSVTGELGNFFGPGTLITDLPTAVTVDGFHGGIQGGYRFQSGMWVFGFEGSIAGADIKGHLLRPGLQLQDRLARDIDRSSGVGTRARAALHEGRRSVGARQAHARVRHLSSRGSSGRHLHRIEPEHHEERLAVRRWNCLCVRPALVGLRRIQLYGFRQDPRSAHGHRGDCRRRRSIYRDPYLRHSPEPSRRQSRRKLSFRPRRRAARRQILIGRPRGAEVTRTFLIATASRRSRLSFRAGRRSAQQVARIERQRNRGIVLVPELVAVPGCRHGALKARVTNYPSMPQEPTAVPMAASRRPVMNSRRLIRSPRRRLPGACLARRGRAPWRS